MRKKNFLLVLLSLILALPFLVGCDQIQSALQSFKSQEVLTQEEEPQPSLGTLLAKVNNTIITLESFDGKVGDLRVLSSEIKLDTLDAKKSYLNDLIIQELIYQEATARGIDKKKDVVDAVEEFRKGIMARQLILDETKGVTVGRSEIERTYEQYKEEMASPVEAHVREIVTSSEQTAREVLIALLQREDFARLARERSVAPSAASGGDLGFLKPKEKFEKFDEVVSTLDVGEVSQIFKGPDGKYYIVKVEEKKGGTPPTLTAVYDDIKEGLLQQRQAQRIEELTERLKRDAIIEIKEELLR